MKELLFIEPLTDRQRSIMRNVMVTLAEEMVRVNTQIQDHQIASIKLRESARELQEAYDVLGLLIRPARETVPTIPVGLDMGREEFIHGKKSTEPTGSGS